MTFTARDLEDFKACAQRLAAELHPPLLVLVSGNLGAGKTTFISEVLRRWGIAGANSPTFNLRNDFNAGGGFRVIHLDFYRLKSGDSALDLLPPDEDYSNAVVFAEWPERVTPLLFQPFAKKASLAITVGTDQSRTLEFTAA